MYIPKASFGYKGSIPDKKIIIFSGAGLSQPSGIQTFRDADGTWNNHKIEDVCDERTWKKNFNLVHSFYNDRRKQLADAEPNIAHKTIARIVEKYGKDNVYNITQNVDNLLERGGCKENEVMHVHGNLTKLECEACGNQWDIGYTEFNNDTDKCPKCGSVKGTRPKIVFFYGSAPMYSYMYRAGDYTMNPDSIFVCIGTMGNVVDVNSTFLMGTPCHKILNNMEPSKDLPEELFNLVYYESCETAITKIEKDIDRLWDGVATNLD